MDLTTHGCFLLEMSGGAALVGNDDSDVQLW